MTNQIVASVFILLMIVARVVNARNVPQLSDLLVDLTAVKAKVEPITTTTTSSHLVDVANNTMVKLQPIPMEMTAREGHTTDLSEYTMIELVSELQKRVQEYLPKLGDAVLVTVITTLAIICIRQTWKLYRFTRVRSTSPNLSTIITGTSSSLVRRKSAPR